MRHPDTAEDVAPTLRESPPPEDLQRERRVDVVKTLLVVEGGYRVSFLDGALDQQGFVVDGARRAEAEGMAGEVASQPSLGVRRFEHGGGHNSPPR